METKTAGCETGCGWAGYDSGYYPGGNECYCIDIKKYSEMAKTKKIVIKGKVQKLKTETYY